jgi:hypothetical protein
MVFRGLGAPKSSKHFETYAGIRETDQNYHEFDNLCLVIEFMSYIVLVYTANKGQYTLCHEDLVGVIDD